MKKETLILLLISIALAVSGWNLKETVALEKTVAVLVDRSNHAQPKIADNN